MVFFNLKLFFKVSSKFLYSCLAFYVHLPHICYFLQEFIILWEGKHIVWQEWAHVYHLFHSEMSPVWHTRGVLLCQPYLFYFLKPVLCPTVWHVCVHTLVHVKVICTKQNWGIRICDLRTKKIANIENENAIDQEENKNGGKEQKVQRMIVKNVLRLREQS